MELFYRRENDYKIDLDDYTGKRLVSAFLAKINEDREVKITKAMLTKWIKEATVFEEIEQAEWYNFMSEHLAYREELINEGDMEDLEIAA
jgi:hypothetical protein